MTDRKSEANALADQQAVTQAQAAGEYVYPNSLHGMAKHSWPAGGLGAITAGHLAPESDDPTHYNLQPLYVTGEIAGRKVRLRLHPEPGMTPDEFMHLWPLLTERVRGNRMFYVLDKKLIRHFVEQPENEEDKLVREAIDRASTNRVHPQVTVTQTRVAQANAPGSVAQDNAQAAAAAATKKLADDWTRRKLDDAMFDVLGDHLVNPPIDEDARPAQPSLTLEVLRDALARIPGFGRRK